MRLVSRDPSQLQSEAFDVIVVGAGAVGAPLAYGLGRSGRKVLLVERDCSEPDRIVGELLQPGGCHSLARLGMLDCLDDIDARLCLGYSVYWGSTSVPIPYPPAKERLLFHSSGLSGHSQSPEAATQEQGRSFHHGRFIQSLRRKAISCPNVHLVDGTVVDVIRSPQNVETIVGVHVHPSSKAVLDSGSPSSSNTFSFYAPLTIVSDGYASKFRKLVLPKAPPAIVRSHFVALLLKDADIPLPNHGHVILRDVAACTAEQAAEKAGPILVYQLSQHDTRMLVDVPGTKLPSVANGDLKAHLERHVVPNLPASLVPSFKAALNANGPESRLRSMPNSFLPAYPQHRTTTHGCLLLGDALNMRHPLTGGGMTVGLGDAVILTELFGADAADPIDLGGPYAPERIKEAAEEWYHRRKGLTGTINVLAQALYTLFSADDQDLDVLKVACFKYFERGGKCVSDPVSMLGGLAPSPALLFYHFFSVAFYGIYLLFVMPRPGRKHAPTLLDWPFLLWRSFSVIGTACVVFVPVIIGELVRF